MVFYISTFAGQASSFLTKKAKLGFGDWSDKTSEEWHRCCRVRWQLRQHSPFRSMGMAVEYHARPVGEQYHQNTERYLAEYCSKDCPFRDCLCLERTQSYCQLFIAEDVVVAPWENSNRFEGEQIQRFVWVQPTSAKTTHFPQDISFSHTPDIGSHHVGKQFCRQRFPVKKQLCSVQHRNHTARIATKTPIDSGLAICMRQQHAMR